MLINVISMNKKSYIVGIFWMIMTSFFFVGVFVTVKYIGDDVPASQSAFLRYLFGTLILAPIILKSLKNTNKSLMKPSLYLSIDKWFKGSRSRGIR